MEREFEFSFSQFSALRKLAHDYSGIHITDDKFEMFYARLAKRVRLLKVGTFASYIKTIKSDKQEFSEFINAITTNVTAFEREPHHFEYLKECIQDSSKSAFNIWSAGCSTGQEPYSILINVLPLCRKLGKTVNLLATDLDTDVLTTAQKGVYSLEQIKSYPLPIKKQFFLKGIGAQQGMCQVKPELRDSIEFRQLNLFYPWQITTKFDFIFCRNVLIYFENAKKLEVIQRFSRNLASQGRLFLGHSELIPKNDDDWQNIGTNIYQLVETTA
ncbi:protein-glutamate O-methyltransferase CheR [Alteromonas sp. ASW11-36]|uniref:Chemotaxis protein methyltransferase n=1 Tax=Alteromonas arenosi TaxID=3055817 RepID=A0ABT7T0C7_9ALTE|nr:protein-glutamate O-methyltransferase CheR [Alteromonas sp. ASW11-36]MDM7861898.1 protein-glutamate O-methyltransferase CheR [Alteromonas sp. ASW11-36]